MAAALRTIRTLTVIAITVATTAAVSFAQGPVRFLGRDDIHLYGIGLRVEPAHQVVPRDIATIVATFLQAPALPDGLPPFAPDAVVRATLRGPSFSVPRELAVRPNTPFDIPPLTVAGIHTVDNIRLESGGAVLLRGAPESVTINVIERLLVTQVTARALTAAEIREKGIVFDSSNFQAYNFSAAFAIEDRKVELNFPVLLPQLQSATDLGNTLAAIDAITPPQLPTLQTIIPDTLRLQTQIPNLSVVGFTLNAPNLEGLDFFVPPIPGVIVIPGDIGFLNQFFSVMLLVGNVAPAGSNLVVDNLRAEIVLPPGYDQVVGTTDDPLAMARTAAGESPRIQVIVQAGADAALGTADDIATVGPGESGSAEYLVEGRREGSHVVEMEISGTLHGLPIGPVDIRGRAAGAVLVRNPTFTLTFTHPEVVSAGEPYTLDVTVSNTSESPANFVTVSLYPRNVSGATIVGDPSRAIETIPPGDSVTVSFDLLSRITGKVTAATLDSNENVSGRFALKTAVGELGVPLSPDSLVLPKEASALPAELRSAAIGLLGKAWAVATAPAAALPPSVQRFSKKVVIDRAVEVAEAGFRVTLHEPAPDSAAQLLMDFAGSGYTRLPEFNPAPADLEFARNNVSGFDALRRTSVRGDTFASAVGALLRPALQSAGAQSFHFSTAQQWSYRQPFVSLLISSAGPLPYTASIVDSQGRRVGGVGENNKITKTIPFSDMVPIGDQAAGPAAALLLLASPEPGSFTVELARREDIPAGPVTISLVVPNLAGDLRQVVFTLDPDQSPTFTPGADDPYQVTFAVAGAPRDPIATTPVPDPSPTVLGVVQIPSADTIKTEDGAPSFPIGRVIALLFSEEVTPASVQDKLAASAVTNYLVENNRAVGVALQPGRRIAFVALRDPLGVYVPRAIAVSNVMDRRGQPMPPASLPIEILLDRGGVVSGRVLRADGSVVPFADVRLFYQTPKGWYGISAKTADSEGRYAFDFITNEVFVKLVVVNPDDDQDFRHVPFSIARNGQRLNVDIVFLGRGTLTGRTLSETGTPLANTSVRITSLTDQSQYGVTTDAHGRFTVARVPVGNVFIEAVNTTVRAELRVSDFIPFAGATITRDMVLLDVVQREITVKHGALSGHVFRADGVTPARDVPVFVYYEHNSQTGVLCPPPPGLECPIAMATTDANGAFALADIVSGRLRVYAFDQGGLSEGQVRFTLNPDGHHEFAVLLSGGLGTVRGIVLDPNGQPVANARVGGGLSLGITNAAGEFTLTDVPIGRRPIVAASDALGASESAVVDILRPGETVNVTIVFGARGSVGGVVYQADGVTPVPNQTVYVFVRTSGGIDVVGSAISNASGGYRVDGVPAGQYFASAVNQALNDGGVVPARVAFHGQVFKADIRFRGGNGTVHGTVFDDDGQTPLAARVAVSGERLNVAGGRVLVEFQHVQYFRIVDTSIATGQFSIPDLLVGPFTLTAAGQFSPDPISFDGVIPTPGANVEANLRLQATSQIAGVVYRPDGVTPVGAGTIVRYHSEAVRVICTEGADGEQSCEAIPQGIQEETVITGDDGRFWLPIVNAGQFTIAAEDVATGRVGEAKGSVRAGERAELAVRLTGIGELTVQVLASDGVTPIPNARVEAKQVEHPRLERSFVADAAGTVIFGGGDSFSEGTIIVTATDQRNGFAGKASARIEHDGQQVVLRVFLFNATGSVSGTLRRSDGVTPVPNAEVVIGNGSGPLSLTLTDASGHYEATLIPLGNFTVEAFEAATSRRAAGSGSINLANEAVPVNLTQLAIGMVKGTLLLAGPLSPLKAWTINLSQPSLAGIARPSLQTTTGLDGTFQFPGTSQGPFGLTARRNDVNGSASGSGAIAREGQIVDVPMIAHVVRPLFGRIQGIVLTPLGQPAANTAVELCQRDNCRISTAGADGAFAFDAVPLGRWIVTARSQVTADAGSAAAELLVDGDVADVRVVMVGLSEITGVVEFDDGRPAGFVELTLDGFPSSGCSTPTCTRFADAAGAFTFINVASQHFTLTAVDPVTGLKGSVGGGILPGEHKVVRVVLQPTARVTGRVLQGNGNPAAGVTAEISWTIPPPGRSLFVTTRPDGTFAFEAVPMVTYNLTFQDPIGPGLARRTGQLAGDVALGDIVLDEAPPQVSTIEPADAATAVPLAQVVRLTFTEPIQPGTISPGNVTLTGPDGVVLGLLNVIEGDRVVTFSPLAPLRDESQYTLRVRNVEDRFSKVMVSDFVAAFRTVDIKAPQWLSIDPAPNTGGVSIYSPIRIKFSEPILPAGFTTPFELRDAADQVVPGRVDAILGNTVMVFTPNLPLAEDAMYRVRLGAAVDLARNHQPGGLDFAITTTDRTPPQIAGLTGPPTVIENDLARVTTQLGATHDVGVVDFYLNDALAFADRSAPFELQFQATPQYGTPGQTIRVSAIATDTSGNRGSPVSVTVGVVADQPPAVIVTAPVNNAAFANGARVTVTVRATDDLGVTRFAFRALTGRPQDAASRTIAPPCRDCSETFFFNVPLDLAPGTAIPIEASAVDSKGNVTAATTIAVTVIDSVSPTVAITGTTTGARVIPGEPATAVVTAQDPGAIASITFTASGAAAFNETRTVTAAQNSVVTSFTFTVPPNAQPGQTVTLDAVATDRAGNIGHAAHVVLPVADRNRPTLVLQTAGGATAAVPGRSVDVVAIAEDEIGVLRIELTGQGAFAYSDARQVSPPSGNPSVTFSVPIPASATAGSVLTLQGRAFDLSGNVSFVANLALTITQLPDVTLPESVLLIAGETTAVTISVPAGAPAGLQLDLRSANEAVATVDPFVLFAAGQTSRTINVTGRSNGTTAISALLFGVERATMTATVRGGVVRGTVFDNLLNPVAGVAVTVTGGFVSQATVSDANGEYFVEGVPGPEITVRALDPITQHRGFASGAMAQTNGVIDLNVILLPAGRIFGVVYLQDGVTPAPAGARLDIFEAQQRQAPSTTTFANAAGEYEFPLVSVGSYVISATDTAGNVGQTTVNINATGDDREANVVYLGRGRVIVQVRDGSGNAVPNAELNFSSNSSFGWNPALDVVADLDGSYTFDGVMVGNFSIVARDAATSRGGTANGQITAHDQSVTVAVTLASFGSVQGTLYRANGTTPVAGARVVANGFYSTTTDDLGHFAFPVIALGSVHLKGTDASTNGVAQATTTLSTNGQSRTVDLVFAAQGTLIVTAVDASGTPVGNARVTVVSGGVYPNQVTSLGSTNAQGLAVIDHVQAGTFVAYAYTDIRSGSTTGTLGAGETQPVTVALAPTASIGGTVYQPDGATPALGSVNLIVTQGFYSYHAGSATIGPDGGYRFDGILLSTVVPAGPIVRTYTVNAHDQAGIWRATASGIELTTNGVVHESNLAFVGLGTVRGQVLNPDSSTASAMSVQVRNLHPTFGGVRFATTDAAGFWELRNVPVAPFSIRTGDEARGILGEAFGELTAHGQTATLDIVLQSNAITLPQNRFDGNNFFFDIQVDGSIANGSSAAFVGAMDNARGAAMLDVTSGGTSTPFTGAVIGTIEDGGREVVTRENGLANLNVSRKVFVPADGYFSRYLETFANPGDQPVTIDVRLRTRVRGNSILWCCPFWEVHSPLVVSTSSGDTVFSVANPATADRWVVVDDVTNADPFLVFNTPSLAFVLDGAAAPQRLTAAAFTAGDAGVVEYQWGNVTVPPGGTVSLMHFLVQQTTRAAATASANRLNSLPPEALDGLSPEEIATIVNFVVPANGISTVAPLESLAGTVTGRAVEGDGSTPVPLFTQVQVRSNHPLFGRTYYASTGEDGRFTLDAEFTDFGGSRMVPVAPFTLTAQHPWTQVAAPATTGAFIDGAVTAERNLVFPTGLLSGTVRRHTGQIVTSGSVSIAGAFATFSSINSEGHFLFQGLPAGNYGLTANVGNQSGTGLIGTASATVAVGQNPELNIVLQSTGAVEGIVRQASGQPSAGTSVHLTAGGFNRFVTTDSGGAFRFDDVPVGVFQVIATEPSTGIETRVDAAVTADAVTTANLDLIAVVSVRVIVTRPSGPAVASSRVQLAYTRNGIDHLRTLFTDAAGIVTFPSVPGGPIAVTAQHPVRSSLQSSQTIMVTTHGQAVDVPMTLPAVSVVTGTVRMPNNSPVSGLTVNLVSSNPAVSQLSAVTNASGVYVIDAVPVGSFTLNTINIALGVQATGSGQVVTDAAVVIVDLQLITNIVQLPIDLFDANGFRYDIQSTGIISQGTNSPFAGAMQLRISQGATSIAANGSGTGLIEDGGREVAIQHPNSNLFGLQLTRKVFVPAGGYMARYLEVLTNPTGSPITVTAQIQSFLNTQLVSATSSGDTTIAPGDLWMVTDDDIGNNPHPPSRPTTAHVIGGAGALQADVTNISSFRLTYAWNGLTVPAGGKVILMHFVSQHFTQPQSIAGVQRLVQLPPEALAGLAADEISAIVNFAVPADGSSSLTPITPAPLGTVSGSVFAHDGTTPVTLSVVTIADPDLFFGRRVTVNTGFGNTFSAALRTGSFTAFSTRQPLVSPTVAGTFGSGATTATANVVFSNTGGVRAVVRRHTGEPVPNATVWIDNTNDSGITGADGTVTIVMQTPGAHLLHVQAPHPQGSALRVDVPFTIMAGQTIDQVAVVEATGTITGVVRRLDGTPVAGAEVQISSFVGTFARYTTTDAAGAFTFADLREGMMSLYATHPVAGVFAQATPTVVRDTTLAVELVFPAIGSIAGTVTNPDGAPVENAVVFISGVTQSREVLTDAAGHYTFTDVRAGCCATVRASVPGFQNVIYRQVSVAVTSDGEVVVANIVLPPRVTLRVHVQNAAAEPLAQSQIFVNGSYKGTTDGDGNLDAANVSDPDFRVQANHFSMGVVGFASGSITDADHGRIIPVLIAPPTTGTIRGSVFAADGVTKIPAFVVFVDVGQGGSVASVDTMSGDFEATVSINGSGYEVQVYPNATGAERASVRGTFATAGETVTHDFTVPVSVIQGRVTYSNGQPVEFPNVLVNGPSPYGGTTTFFNARNDADGNYLILNVQPGAPFTLTAQDNTGLPGSANGEVLDITIPVTLDVSLLPTGRVEGVVRDAGVPVPYIWVELQSAVPGANGIGVSADENGQFVFPTVPVSPFMLRACWWPRCGELTTALTAEGQTLVLTLNLPAPVNVAGVVVEADGVTPVASASVVLRHQATGSSYFTDTAGDGTFSFLDLGDGDARITVQRFPDAAVTDLVLIAGHQQTVTMRLGNAVIADVRLIGSDQFVYDFECDGRLSSGGTVDGELSAYSRAYRLRVGSNSAACQDVMRTEESGREIVIGPAKTTSGEDTGEFETTRKIFVPPTGGFARYLDIVRNTASVASTLTVRLTGNMATAINMAVTAESTGRTYAVSTAFDESALPVGHTFAGPVAAHVPTVFFDDEGRSVSYEWEVTIPPGESVAFLTFTAQRAVDDVAGATAQAAALAALTDPNALTGLSPLERGLIVNFVVPNGAAPIVGAISGTVRDAVGPLAGAFVYAVDEVSGRLLARTQTGPGGTYRFTGLRPAAGVRLVAASFGEFPVETVVVFAFTGQELTGIDLRLDP